MPCFKMTSWIFWVYEKGKFYIVLAFSINFYVDRVTKNFKELKLQILKICNKDICICNFAMYKKGIYLKFNI